MKKDDVFDLHDCIVLKVVTGYSCNSSIFKDNFELFVFLLFLCEPIAVLNEGSIPISRFFQHNYRLNYTEVWQMILPFYFPGNISTLNDFIRLIWLFVLLEFKHYYE